MNDDEYLIVEVEDARGLAKDLVDFYQHYVGAQIFDTPLLSYASILLDKLRVSSFVKFCLIEFNFGFLAVYRSVCTLR